MKNHGYVHLSAGDLLREEVNSKSENGELINNYIKNGEIVPVEITINLLKTAMVKAGWATKKFLIDGFPRNEDNCSGWEKVVGDSAEVKGVIYFEVPEDVLEERIMQRAVSSGRVDDTREAAKKRFLTYTTQTFPII